MVFSFQHSFLSFRTFLKSRCCIENRTIQWSISRMNTKCLHKLLRRIAARESRERGNERERGGEEEVREFETQDLSTRILSRQLLSARGVNVIGRIIANHPVCVQAATRDILAYPLVLGALWQIDSANLLFPNPLRSILHIRCEFSPRI